MLKYLQYAYLLTSILFFTGCTSTSFVLVGEERGQDPGVTEVGSSDPTRSIRIKQGFDAGTSVLSIKAEMVETSVKSKLRRFEYRSKFEERQHCRGWCADDATFDHASFWFSHLILFGFLLDPFALFYTNEARTGIVKTEPLQPIEESFEETVEKVEPLDSGAVTVEIALPSGKILKEDASIASGSAAIKLNEQLLLGEFRDGDRKKALETMKSIARIERYSNEESFSLESYAKFEMQRRNEEEQEKFINGRLIALKKAMNRGATHLIFGYQCNANGICQSLVDNHYGINRTRICPIKTYTESLTARRQMNPTSECPSLETNYFVVEGSDRNLSRDTTLFFGALIIDSNLVVKKGNPQTIKDGYGQLFEAQTFRFVAVPGGVPAH